LRLTKTMQKSRVLQLSEISPALSGMLNLNITIPGSEKNDGIFINSFDPTVIALPTKTKPKKITLRASDGKNYSFLLKGLEDLHLDERIMQIFETVDALLADDDACRERRLSVNTYSITPIGDFFGMIQWVDNVTSAFTLYKRWQKGIEGSAEDLLLRRPNEQFISKISEALKARRISRSLPRKNWPHDLLLGIYQELLTETPSDLISNEVQSASSSPDDWLQTVNVFARSTAVMSMLGYVIGLGDRHLDNILLDFETGSVVHIDFNVCFGKGLDLRVPETVPFRLTPNIRAGFGISGIEGAFRASCEATLRVLRGNTGVLLGLLDCFRWSPLASWKKEGDDERDKGSREALCEVQLIGVEIDELNDRVMGNITEFKALLAKSQGWGQSSLARTVEGLVTLFETRLGSHVDRLAEREASSQSSIILYRLRMMRWVLKNLGDCVSSKGVKVVFQFLFMIRLTHVQPKFWSEISEVVGRLCVGIWRAGMIRTLPMR
jgi:phosphatidylinositol kinase/protein kinase (PI-3  family)